MKKSLKSILVLFAICAVMALLLAVTNSFTSPIIQKNQEAAANEALLVVMPNGEGFEKMDISTYELPDTVTEVYKEANGGYVFRLNATGYQPNMIIMCGVSASGTVTGSVCLSSNETWGKEKTLGDLLVGADIDTLVDIEAGATSLTVKGYRSAIRDALNAAIILGGGTADTRTEEEIFNDNLAAALPAAEGKFTRLSVVDADYVIDFIYAADNGSGYVYVLDKVFVGMDAEGNLTVEGIPAETVGIAQGKAALAMSQTTVDTTDTGINGNVTRVQKTADGNYLIDVNGLGFAYFGDESMYQPAKNIPIEICVLLSPDAKILKCLTASQQESGGYGAVCGDESYYSRFDGKTEADYREVDAIANATITTDGYFKAIERAFAAVKILEGGNE